MERVTIHQWGQFHTLYLPLYVAHHADFFARNGIVADIRAIGNDDRVYQSLLRGEADFTVSDPIYAAMGHNRAEIVPIKAVATLVNKIAIWGITNQPTIRPVEHIEDLAGLRLGCFPKGSTTYALLDGLKKNHPRILKRTEFVEGTIDNQVEMLANGTVDIALEIEPVVSYAVSKGFFEVFSLAQFFGDCVFTGLCVRQDMIDNRPDVVRAVVQSLQMAMDAIHGDSTVLYDVARTMFPDIPAKVQRSSTKRILNEHVWPISVAIDEKSWNLAQSYRVETGDLTAIQPFDATVDNSFAG